MDLPMRGRVALASVVALLALVLGVLLALPSLGTWLVVDGAPQAADVALILEGAGTDAIDVAETWRRAGLVRDVVVIEAPVRTHALVAYWSDFVRLGLAAPPATPPAHLRVIRAPSTQSAEQGRAAAAALQELSARSALVPGGGGIGSRLVERDLQAALHPIGISVRLASSGVQGRDPSRWYANAEDRRAVLDAWLQLLVPGLSG